MSEGIVETIDDVVDPTKREYLQKEKKKQRLC